MAEILVIDDDTLVLSAVEVVLNERGHRCRLFTRPEHVLVDARRDKPDLFIIDLMLPGGVSGFELCRRIRRDDVLFTKPILVLSAMASEEEMEHALSQGADDFIAKPFEPIKLSQRVASLLHLYESTICTDELTSLPGSESAKRNIQRRLSVGEEFGLACAELFNISTFGREYGTELRQRVIRNFARALIASGERLVCPDVFIGHMGSGHFVIILPAEHTDRYCEMVQRVWANHILRMRENGEEPLPPDALICATMNIAGVKRTSQQLLETLAQMRNKAVRSHVSGVYIDKRAPTLIPPI